MTDRILTPFKQIDWQRATVILSAQVSGGTAAMARSRRSKSQEVAALGAAIDDLYDYGRPPKARSGRPAPEDPTTWTVKDDWPEPGTQGLPRYGFSGRSKGLIIGRFSES
jgi:hypothetical protein